MERPAPLRVMHVVPGLTVGGMEGLLVELIRRSDPGRVRHAVCCVEEPGELAPLVTREEVPVFLVRKLHGLDPTLVLRLTWLFRRWRPAIVHSYSGVYRDGTLSARLARVPIVVHSDHGVVLPDRRWSRWNHWAASFWRDRIVCVSEAVSRYMVEQVGIPERKITVIYNGIDTSQFAPRRPPARLRAALGLDGDGPVLLSVGMLTSIKGFDVLLEAAALVRARYPGLRLLICGDGEERAALVAQADALGLGERVRFLGIRRDMPDLYALADLVVLASRTESFSLVAAEAMACERAVVMTAVGGVPEVVEDGKTGLLVPPERPGLLAEAISRLLGDPSARAAMGAAGRARVEARFRVEAMVAQLQELYEALARDKGLLEPTAVTA